MSEGPTLNIPVIAPMKRSYGLYYSHPAKIHEFKDIFVTRGLKHLRDFRYAFLYRFVKCFLRYPVLFQFRQCLFMLDWVVGIMFDTDCE